jgi:hypothetical protein
VKTPDKFSNIHAYVIEMTTVWGQVFLNVNPSFLLLYLPFLSCKCPSHLTEGEDRASPLEADSDRAWGLYVATLWTHNQRTVRRLCATSSSNSLVQSLSHGVSNMLMAYIRIEQLFACWLRALPLAPTMSNFGRSAAIGRWPESQQRAHFESRLRAFA